MQPAEGDAAALPPQFFSATLTMQFTASIAALVVLNTTARRDLALHNAANDPHNVRTEYRGLDARTGTGVQSPGALLNENGMDNAQNEVANEFENGLFSTRAASRSSTAQ